MMRRSNGNSPICSVADVKIWRAEGPWLLGLMLFVGAVSLWPLARLLVAAASPDLLADIWSRPATVTALTNTLTTSLLATLLSVLLGGGLALVIGTIALPGRAAMGFVLLLPLLIPPQITALAWAELLGPGSPLLTPLGLAPPAGQMNPLYSGGGIALVMGVEHATIVFLTVRAALRGLPADLIEAARLAGAGPLWVGIRIILPLVRPALLAGAAIAFVSSIGNFGVPALLGIPGRYPMLTTLIYRRLNGFGPKVFPEVAALALLLIGLAVIGLALRAWFAHRGRLVIERGSRPFDVFAPGQWRWPVLLLVWVLLVGLCVVPLLALLAASLVPAVGVPFGMETIGLGNFAEVLDQAAVRRAFGNSALLAGLAALLTAALAVPLAYLAVMRRLRLARLLDLAIDAPYAVPGVVLALGMILVFVKPVFGVALYGTFALLLIAYLARFFALAARPVAAAFEALDRTLDDAARMAGAGLATRLRRILLPLVAPSALAGALLVFLTAFNELTVSALLWSSGQETLGVMVFALHSEGNGPAASAIAVLSILVTLALALGLTMLGRRLPPGSVPWQG